MEKCAVDPGRQLVYCQPVWPFPVFEVVWNLQGWRQDLACSPNLEWYLHNPGRSGHVWSDLVFTLWFLFWAWCCPGSMRKSPIAFAWNSFVSLDASVILSACKARSSLSVFFDEAKILLTSEGSWARKSALNSVSGSTFKLRMCWSNSDGFLSPKPLRFSSSWSFSGCVLLKALTRKQTLLV